MIINAYFTYAFHTATGYILTIMCSNSALFISEWQAQVVKREGNLLPG